MRKAISDIEIFEQTVEFVEKTFMVDIPSKFRGRDSVHARVIVSKIIRDTTVLPFHSIGKRFNRDHSSIVHYLRNFESYKFDTGFTAKYSMVKEFVRSITDSDYKVEGNSSMHIDSRVNILEGKIAKALIRLNKVDSFPMKSDVEDVIKLLEGKEMKYTTKDISKILGYTTWDDKTKYDTLLEIDSMMYAALGTDSTRKEREAVRVQSRRIYKAIDKIYPGVGKGFIELLG